MSEKTKIGLVQINNSFSGQNYLPYSVAILQAYAQKYLPNPDQYEFMMPVYSRIAVKDAVEQLRGADMVAFSTYVWNYRISLKIAEGLKKLNPETLIVFGGPHVPDRVEQFLRENPFIDIACHGEGENAFVVLLEQVKTRQWDKVPSISYIAKDGSLIQNPRAERIREIDKVPSPFLDGTFDSLMKANPDEHWIALWETNRGCPFSCTFCDWGSAVASKVNAWELERLYQEIRWFSDRKIEYVFCADANFGIFPRDVDIVRYLADMKQKTGYPQALSVQNTKNATERSYMVQKILSDAGLNKGVVVSLQSVDPTTLKAIKRDNIKLETYHEIQRRFAAGGVETLSDLILPLPGETYESFASGVELVIKNGQHNRIQFNNLSILPNAEMGDPEYQKKYGMVLVRGEVVNIHGELALEEVPEVQDLVVGTTSMPGDDWVRARSFAWMVAFLYFDKLLQIPMAVLHKTTGLGHREMTELFSDAKFLELAKSGDKFPILTEIRQVMWDKAKDIQNGGKEYVHSKEWLNIWWPSDEYCMIKICKEGKLAAFYEEARRALEFLLEKRSLKLDSQILKDAVELNKNLVKMPFVKTDLEVELSYNIGEFYKAAITDGGVSLEKKPSTYFIDRTKDQWASWDDWCRKVVWWGNRKGAYLYGKKLVDKNIAGHF